MGGRMKGRMRRSLKEKEEEADASSSGPTRQEATLNQKNFKI